MRWCVNNRGVQAKKLCLKQKQRGLEAQENWQYGFFTRDPDGAVVQFV